MNFLEQLAAEWYEYSGYFVRTNIHAHKRQKGGWNFELDVLAFEPSKAKLIHIETSGGSESWKQRKEIFLKKFRLNDEEYEGIIGTKIKIIKRIAVCGWSRKTDFDRNWKEGLEVLLIPEFLHHIIDGLHGRDFLSEAVPESYPILRTIQMMDNYQDLMMKK